MCMDGTYLVPNEGKYYTFANDGHWIESGSSSNTNNANSGSWFKSDDDHWQYKLNGQNVTDWQKLDGVWYYFDPTNAWSVTGWQWINGHWYYFDPANTWMLTGWQNINGKNYYFTPSGAWDDQSSDNQDNTPGKWLNDYGHWYFIKSNGKRAKLEWLTINGKKYYFDINGIMAANGWVITYPNKEDYMESRNDVEYYFDANGQIVR